MITDEQYQQFFKKVGKELKISGRVIRHFRNSYKGKYADLSYNEAIPSIRREAKRKLVALRQNGIPAIREVTYLLLRPNGSLEKSTVAIQQVKAKINFVYGYIDKTGYYESIVRFSQRVTEEQMRIIVESDPLADEKRDIGGSDE